MEFYQNMQYKIYSESAINFYIPTETKISKKLPVFYNPKMKLGRDVAIHIIKKAKSQNICDPMAGTGIRSLRILKETNCKNILANDINPNAYKLIKKNAKLNNLNLEIKNQDLNILFREKKGFDYIDIEPFGSPVAFIDSSLSALKNKGILAVTATDLGNLFGKYPKKCLRRYHSLSLKTPFKNELATRILIQKLQKSASKYDKCLTPIFTHANNHYVRVYLQLHNSKTKTDNILKKHNYLHYCPKCLQSKISKFNNPQKCCNTMQLCGPIWTGELWDTKFTKDFELIKHIQEESQIKTLGYYNLDSFYKKYKKHPVDKIDNLVQKIKSKKYKASRTHFSNTGIRSNIPLKDLLKHILAFLK